MHTIPVDAAEHPIKAVTIFASSKAEVVRTFRVPLEAGENTVEISRLPTSIDTESTRVTGLGDAQLFDVVCSIGKEPSIPPADNPDEAVRLLETKLAVLNQQRRTIAEIKGNVSSYSRSLNSEHISPSDAEGFFDKVLARHTALDARSAELDEEILRLQREIEVKTHKNNKHVGGTDGRVTVVVMAVEQTEAEFKLTYIVNGATWYPTYELHATTGESGLPSTDVSLQYRVRIQQTTGEDWTNVALTLSTSATDVSQDSIPEFKPTRIRPPAMHVLHAPPQTRSLSGVAVRMAKMAKSGPPPPPLSRSGTVDSTTRGGPVPLFASAPAPISPPGGGGGPSYDFDEEAGSDSASWDEPAEAQAMKESRATVKESPLAHAYAVEGASSVPSDGIAHKVSVATLPFQASVQHIVVPKAKAVTYLQARVKNTSDYRLLPGAVHVFMDDSFVSKTSIKDIAPGDTFDCALGPDPGARIIYSRLSKRDTARNSVFTEQYVTYTYTARTVIRNTHPYDLEDLIVRDGIPVSEDSAKVRVLLHKPQALVDAKDEEEKQVDCEEGGKCKVRWTKVDDASKGGKKQGMYEWLCKVGAGEKLVLVAEWVVKAPTDVKWVEQE